MTDSAEDPDLVLLEFHPGTATVSETTAGQCAADVFRGELDAGGNPLDDSDQGLSMGLSGGQPTQCHGSTSSFGDHVWRAAPQFRAQRRDGVLHRLGWSKASSHTVRGTKVRAGRPRADAMAEMTSC